MALDKPPGLHPSSGLADFGIDGYPRLPPPDVGTDEWDLIFADSFQS